MRARATALVTVLAATRPVPRALAGFAGLAVVAAWAWPAEVIAPAPPAPTPVPVRMPDSGAAVRRPLFDPERRAWTARGDLSDLALATPVRPVLRVRGILMTDGSGRALIEEEGAGNPVWLAPGDGRAGWVLASVQAERVTVRQDGRTYDLAFLGEPAVLQPPRRQRPADRRPREAVAPSGPPPADAPALRLVPETAPSRVRTIPITPSGP